MKVDRAPAWVQVRIDGPVLLLIGPIGLFFARFCRYLRSRGVPVTKVAFPLHEFGFPSDLKVAFDKGMDEWRPFLRELLSERGIRHIFMYGDFIIPHRIAIEEARHLGIEAWVFELGYIRPNYVTLERDRVNARSNLNQPVDFYRALPAVEDLPQGQLHPGCRWRKVWKAPTFIQHALTRYTIIEGEHKLQPTPGFLWCQLRGSWRYWIYRCQEAQLKRRLLGRLSFFLVVLQVSNDSQIQLSSPYRGMYAFIEDVVRSFAAHAYRSEHLAIKHHPRDRGYNDYGNLIHLLARQYGIEGRVHYFHDGPISQFLRTSRGVVTVNSSVGLQSIYHSAPTKVMGHTFYNLPGLTDQQPLDQFWRAPQPTDRALFQRFYSHLVTTTQVNGNFEADFPFAQTFPIGASPAPPARPPSVQRRRRAAPVALVCRIVSRGCWAGVFFALYALQLLALGLKRHRLAAALLTTAAGSALKALGVQVVVDDDRPGEPSGVPMIHLYNHESPLDVLVVQGALSLPSLTTANLHLSRTMPWFEASAANAGHGLLNHLDGGSRKAALYKASRILRERGQVMLAPNGSLVTPVNERVSPSALLLARRHGALIVPWTFTYHDLPSAADLRYKPLALLLARLTAPTATIRCQRGLASDLGISAETGDRQAFVSAVQSYYANRLRPPGSS